MITRKGTFTVRYMDEDREEHFATEREAHIAAQDHVGNRSAARCFPNENTYLYGPGDGTTSVMVREDVDFA